MTARPVEVDNAFTMRRLGVQGHCRIENVKVLRLRMALIHWRREAVPGGSSPRLAVIKAQKWGINTVMKCCGGILASFSLDDAFIV